MTYHKILIFLGLNFLIGAAAAEVRATEEEIVGVLREAGLVNVMSIGESGVAAGFPESWSVDSLFAAASRNESTLESSEVEGLKELARRIASSQGVVVALVPTANTIRYRVLWPAFVALSVDSTLETKSEDELFAPLRGALDALSLPQRVGNHGLVSDYRGLIYFMDFVADDWHYGPADIRQHVDFLLKNVAPAFDSWTAGIWGESARMMPPKQPVGE